MESKYTIIQQGDTVQSYILSVAVDKKADVDGLPTSWPSGSTCLVIEDSSVWMLGNDHLWHEL